MRNSIKLRREMRAAQAAKLAGIRAARQEKQQGHYQIIFQELVEEKTASVTYWICGAALVFLAGTCLYNL